MIAVSKDINTISNRKSVFTVMWIVSIFFHMIHRSDIVSGIFPLLTVLSGLFVLHKPNDTIRLVIFSLFHACVYIIHAPNTANHSFFAFIVDLTIIIIYGLNFFKSNRFDYFSYLNALLRSFTIILYFFAVFHKLNWNYLDFSSCGGTMLLDPILSKASRISFFSDMSTDVVTSLRYASIYASLTLEILIPFFLLNRRLSWVGCLLGVILHGTLGFIYFWHFSPMLYALYILFLPDSFYRKIFEVINKFKIAQKNVVRIIGFLILVVLMLYVLKFHYPEIEMELGDFSRKSGRNWSFGLSIRTLIGWIPFIIYTLLFTYFLLSFNKKDDNYSLKPVTGIYYIFPLILVINGFSPYLGLKTHHSFSMFSGLMTHGNTNNHLFMPNIDFLKTQNDIVTPAFQNHSNFAKELRWSKDENLVFYELQKRITELKQKGYQGIELNYWRNGKETHIKNAENDTNLIIPITWLDKKFRIFQEIPINSKGCHY